MATFLELSEEIQSDVGGRTDNVIKAQVDSAINRAIEYYEDERFEFNTGQNTDITTTVNVPDYALPAEVLYPHEIQYSFAGYQYRLSKRTYQWYLEIITQQESQVGPTDYYAIYGRRLYLYPSPSTSETLTISAVLRQPFVPLSADGDTNVWTNQALGLIRARAKWDLYSNRFKNAALAAINKQDVSWYLSRLRENLVKTETIGVIPAPSPF
jgi:hypothetical protein